ncbi:MAG: hypothetical protein AAFX54_15420 [Pseudomonadota bacterium]
MIEMRWKRKVNLLAAVAAAALCAAPTGALAQASQCAEDEGPSKTLSTAVARVLQEVFVQMQAEEYQPALAALNELIANRGGSMPAYDAATTYELRGSVKASLEDFRGALGDFQRALNYNALPNTRNNQLRYFIAQLQFQEEQYQAAITGLNQWIQNARSCSENVDPNAYYLLAAAYTQITPANYRAALDPARRAVAANKAQGEPRKAYYDILNLIYSELGDDANRAPLLEEMINIWPGTKGYWTQLSGAYSQTGNDREAFSVLEVAYRAGLLTTESELLTLVQYYSFFDNPYRGGELLDREMAAGNIDRDQDNLILLSQLWSQAREHKRSIPILREAASGAPNGELYYRLGQVLLADEQYAASQRALENAVNRGGMDRGDTGDAWLLLGTARFNQAGPEDTAIWASARQAFVNAQRYENVRGRASQWVSYIDAVAQTYRDGKRLERLQREERCRDELQRLEQQQRIRDLQNREPTEEELAAEAQTRSECEAILAGDEAPSEGADDSDADEG